jgi:hypothetical protein
VLWCTSLGVESKYKEFYGIRLYINTKTDGERYD